MLILKSRLLVPYLVSFSLFTSSPILAADVSSLKSISIPSLPLNQAVTELAVQTGLNIGGNADLLKGKKSSELEGSYTPEEALDRLLDGSGVTYKFTEKNTVTLKNNSKTNDTKQVGKAIKRESVALNSISVIGNKDNGYTSNTARSATGTDTSLFDTPRSIQVVTELAMEQQQAQDLRDVLQNVSGVIASAKTGNTTDSFSIRGIDSATIFQNGYNLNGSAIRVQTANIDKVEVLKGPAALLFGQSSAGGIVNVITKKPQQESYNSIAAHFDKFGQKRVELDSTGAINEDGSLLYRFVGSLEESDTFRKTDDFDHVSRGLIAPSLTWHVDDRNSLTASFEWIDSSLPRSRGTVLVEDDAGNLALADVPRSRRFGEAGDSSDTIQQTATLDFTHVFQNDWQMDSSFVYQANNSNTHNVNAAAGIGTVTSEFLPGISNVIAGISTVNFNAVPASGDLVRIVNQFSNNSESYFGSLRFTGSEVWGGIEHSVVAGLDYNHRDTVRVDSQPFLSPSDVFIGPLSAFAGLVPSTSLFSQLSILNIYDPDYGLDLSSFTDVSKSDTTDKQLGLFVQDTMELSDEWTLALGLRVDRFKRDSTSTSYLTALPGTFSQVGFVEDTQKQDLSQDTIYEASPNAGLIFQPITNVSIYTSYSEAFEPNDQSVNTLTGETENIDPTTSEQYELGVKTSLLDNDLTFNLAYFDITRENVASGTDSLTGVTLVNGEERSKGVEFDANLRISDNLNLLFAYAYIDAEIKGGDNNGNRVFGIPKHSASVWGSYQLNQGDLNGLGVAGGAVYRGKAFVDSANTFELDSYTTFDITTFYTTSVAKDKTLRLQLGVKNLTDKQYYVASNNSLDIGVGRPRTFFGSIAVEF